MESTPARRRSARLRLIVGTAGALCLGATGLVAAWALRLERDYARESARVLAVCPVDLSSSGEHRIAVRVDHAAGHGLKLQLDAPAIAPEEIRRRLEGLQAAAILSRCPWGTSDVVMELGVVAQFASGPDPAGLARLPGSPPGDYEVALSVRHGAASLRGVPHRLLIRNDVCGCEL